MGAERETSKTSGGAAAAAIESVLARWQGREGGQERANYGMFLSELCAALSLPPPDPAGGCLGRGTIRSTAMTIRRAA